MTIKFLWKHNERKCKTNHYCGHPKHGRLKIYLVSLRNRYMCYLMILSMPKIIYHWVWMDEWGYGALVECHWQAKKKALRKKPSHCNIVHHKSYTDWPRNEPNFHSDRPASGMILTGNNQSSWSKTCPSATLSTTDPVWTGLGLKPSRHSEGPATNSLDRYDWSHNTYRRIQKWSCQCIKATKCHPTTWTRQQWDIMTCFLTNMCFPLLSSTDS